MFKMTLRDLFWLVLVAAVGCGWWVHHARELKERETSEYLLKNDIEMLLLQRDSWKNKYHTEELMRPRLQERAMTDKERYEEVRSTD